MAQISVEDGKTIMGKLLQAVNAPDDFDFSQKNWYLKYTWTQAEQDQFRDWLAKFPGKRNTLHTGDMIYT